MRRTEYQILLATIAAITFAAGSVIVGFQVVIRQLANEPQRQLVDQTAAQLRANNTELSLAMAPKVDLGNSQAPFITVYDTSKHVIASSGVLHETTPRLPEGVLVATVNGQINEVTWAPEDGIRLAAVAKQVSADGKTFYVVAARSLAATETLKANVTQVILAAWAAVMLLLGAAAYYEGQRASRKKK